MTGVDLDIWLGDTLVARTVTRGRSGKVRIEYDAATATKYGPEVPLLSCSLPTPGPSEPLKAQTFLEGLLPEGRALDTAAAQVRGVRLVDRAPETPADAVALLAEYGRECAGAIVVLRSEQQPSFAGTYEPLDEDALARMIRDLPEHPLGADLQRGIRMSLGGAQEKLLLSRIDGQWCMPVDGAPSTHIIKPESTWANSAHNEALVLDVARACGLTAAASWVERMGDTFVLVAERYDRCVENGRIIRTHQEDMCQAIGMRPKDKYQVGRPSSRMAKVLREFAATPRAEIERLFVQTAFRAVVGDEDGHGKNYSLLLDEGRVSLSPLYDTLCTLIYPELDGTMATPIGNQQSLAKVDRAALLDEARQMGVSSDEATDALDKLTASLRQGIADLDDGLTARWASEQIIDTILGRVDRLESGQPLGGQAEWPGGSLRRNLDQATAARQTPTLGQGRVQRGVPAGGQFTARQGAEADIDL